MVIVCTIVISLCGLFAYLSIPIEAVPDMTDITVQIITKYPGRATEEVEKQITFPIEIEMNGLPHMKHLRSDSLLGLSVVNIIFDDTVDKYFARQLVLERLKNVDLPEGAEVKLGPLSTPIGELYSYTLESSNHTPMELRTIQDWFMRKELKRVQGVIEVIVWGGQVKQYQILVDPIKLRSLGITLQEVFDVLSLSNKNTGGGYLRINDEQFVLRGIGLLSSLDDIKNTVIKASNGVPVKIDNIATVQIGPAVRHGITGRDSINDVSEASILMRRDENPSIVLKRIKVKLAELQKRLPEGIKITNIYDQERLIKRTIHTVRANLVLGMLLVFLLLMFFTGNLTLTFIVSLIVPLSLLVAFIFMRFFNVTANLLSLGAVDFGIVIDGAVVMTEAIFVALASHPNFKDSAPLIVQLGGRVGKPILFAKAIIVLAFLPLFALERVEGKLFRPLMLTMIFAVLGALFFALTLVPVLCSLLFKGNVIEKEIKIMKKIEKLYMPFLHWLLERPKKVFVFALGCMITGLLFIPFLGMEFMPIIDEGAIWLRATMPVSISIEKAHEITPKIVEKIKSFPQVKTVLYQIGRPEEETDPNLQNTTEMFVDLIPKIRWGCNKEELVQRIDDALVRSFPGIQFYFSQPIEDNVDEAIAGVKGRIGIKIFGPDLNILMDLAKKVYSQMLKVKGVTDLYIDNRLTGQPQLLIKADRSLCAKYGVSITDVQNVIEAALAGKVATKFIEEEKRFDVVVRLLPEYRSDFESIKSLLISNADRTVTIPIGQLATVQEHIGAPFIDREDMQRRATIRFNIRKRDMGSIVSEGQRLVSENIKLPEGYSIVWSGQYESLQRSMKRLSLLAPISIFFIFMLLFTSFGSIINALLILITIPLAAIGGVLGLYFLKIHLSVSAMVGFVALSGVSVQNGIILVSVFNRLIEEGLELKDAIINGVKERLRPVIMTSLLASMGLLPAAFSTDTGSEAQRPFAIVIVFGMISALILTLIVLPTMFYWIERIRNK